MAVREAHTEPGLRRSKMAQYKTIFDLLDDYGEFRKEFAKELIVAIEKSGMTQREVAEKAGISEVSMSRYANGFRMPTIYNLMRIWKAMGRLSDEPFMDEEHRT